MDKNKLQNALKKVKESANKRNFKQSYDLVVSLQNLNLKKPDQHVDKYASLHYGTGKKKKICAFVGPELKDEASKVCDLVIIQDDFQKYSDKKKAKDLAKEYDYFIAQANIMAKVATSFGKILGTRGKMPNPKAGCVVHPKANLKPLYDKLQKTVRVMVKTQPQFQCIIGNEDSKDEELLDNAETILKQLKNALPNHEANIKAVYLKLSMSKPVKVK